MSLLIIDTCCYSYLFVFNMPQIDYYQKNDRIPIYFVFILMCIYCLTYFSKTAFPFMIMPRVLLQYYHESNIIPFE